MWQKWEREKKCTISCAWILRLHSPNTRKDRLKWSVGTSMLTELGLTPFDLRRAHELSRSQYTIGKWRLLINCFEQENGMQNSSCLVVMRAGSRRFRHHFRKVLFGHISSRRIQRPTAEHYANLTVVIRTWPNWIEVVHWNIKCEGSVSSPFQSRRGISTRLRKP